MEKKYAVVIKTGEAELRAVDNLPQKTLSDFLPIVELTRGRKIKEKDDVEKAQNIKSGVERYPSDRRIERIKSIFVNQTICIDLTADKPLSNNLIDGLFDSTDGYQKWITFLLELKNNSEIKEIIPCIIMNVEDPDFEENLKKQVTALCENFNSIAYRNYLNDDYCYDDIEFIKAAMSSNTNFIYILDSGYIVPASHKTFLEKIDYRLSEMSKQLPPNTKSIICGTSFPKQVSEIGHDYTDSFKLVEKVIFDELKDKHDGIIYGDYGTINPVRNDDVVMARGWIPRIDIPIKDEVYYYRLRRPKGTTKYTPTYIEVSKLAKSDARFPSSLKSNWGVEEVERCAGGKPSSSSPSFWISVRMNIHIQQQVENIKTL